MENLSTSGTPAPATIGAKDLVGIDKAASRAARRKRWRQNLILLTVSTLLALVAGEFVLRWAMFHGGENFKNLQNPSKYYYSWDADYWKLNYRFDTINKPPKHPHPYLGWVDKFHPQSYYHNDGLNVGKRRPVLLYGDSFSQCVEQVVCFQTILNADSTFSADNYMLNYGIGGYGVCQTSLLCRKTAPHYEKPLVVFGMLTSDMERTALPVRTGQKPYYDVENGKLVLKGLPIDSVAAHYYAENPPAVTSYLLRLFLHSRFNIVPYRIETWFTEKEKSLARIQEVNRLLIKQTAADLRAMDIDFVFLIFHFEDATMSPKKEENWHDQFLRKTLADEKIPYIWSKDIVRAHLLAHPENTYEDYILPGNGHPTTLYNELISTEIKRIALERPRSADFQPDTLNMELYSVRTKAKERAIWSDAAALEAMALKAANNNVSLERQVQLDAIYLMNIELSHEKPFGNDGVFEGKWKDK